MKNCKIPATLIKMSKNNLPAIIVLMYLSVAGFIGVYLEAEEYAILSVLVGVFWSLVIPIGVILLYGIVYEIYKNTKKYFRDLKYYGPSSTIGRIRYVIKDITYPLCVLVFLTLLFQYGAYFSDFGGVFLERGFGFLLVFLLLGGLVGATIFMIYVILHYIIDEYKRACNQIEKE